MQKLRKKCEELIALHGKVDPALPKQTRRKLTKALDKGFASLYSLVSGMNKPDLTTEDGQAIIVVVDSTMTTCNKNGDAQFNGRLLEIQEETRA